MAQNTFRKQNTTPPETTENYQGTEDTSENNYSESSGNTIFSDPRVKVIFGLFLIFFSIFSAIAILSFLFTGKADQSVVESLFQNGIRDLGRETENWLGLFGAIIAHAFIFKGFGLASFLFLPLFFALGTRLALKLDLFPLRKYFYTAIFFIFWVPISFGYMVFTTHSEDSLGFLCGAIGYELGVILHELLGIGTILFVLFTLVVFMVIKFNFLVQRKISTQDQPKGDKESINQEITESDQDQNETIDEKEIEAPWQVHTLETQEGQNDPISLEVTYPPQRVQKINPFDLELEVTKTETQIPDIKTQATNEAHSLGNIDQLPPYDPTLELSKYEFPPISLLREYGNNTNNGVSEEELKENQNKIVETLGHFKIGITKIKATIGPTVTLYEIIPEAGIKITKISNLSDDIALRLSALGVRIIAPMPGKGTIGIEVPNKNKQMVSAREVLSDPRFSRADMELPIAFGKTISNEVYVEDLTKMPHLLMAGATGMGKSVGINMLLASLLYKKHPSQLKIVMVDPKKVELSLYNKLERHFLAMLPDGEEAILTDTKKVIHTLNSLCIEMDTRYSLLRDANCRNLKEYNPKFVSRKLNPNDGHRYLPYIVVVIDELADLMITAGKEIETPIARLAQLARAVGIHLVLATQRPSVNVITGLIKANFPARLSFRVTSKIDSRTILDESGSDQLIGKGDMLLKLNADMVRLQCAFIDTPEVEELVDFIGNQRGYDTAYQLPEFFDENADPSSKEVDLSNKDPKFEEAAELVVRTGQGSTSLIQRKLSLGYARSGRIMDQLEAAGIVGPPNGSKVRDVLIKDLQDLQDYLKTL